MNKPDSIAICKDHYPTEEDFWGAVGQCMKLMTDNEYICTFRYEDVGVYIVEYAHADREMGDLYPIWLTSEQEESLDI